MGSYRTYGIYSDIKFVVGSGAAVPEPTTLGLFALTLLGTAGRRRRA